MNTDPSPKLCLEPRHTLKSNGILEKETRNDNEEYSEFSNNCTGATYSIKDADSNVDSSNILDNIEPDQFQFDDIRIPSLEGYSEVTSEFDEMSFKDSNREEDVVSIQKSSQSSSNSVREAPVIQITIDRTTHQSDESLVDNEPLSLPTQLDDSNNSKTNSTAQNSVPDKHIFEFNNCELQKNHIPLERRVSALSISTEDVSTCNSLTQNNSETILPTENEAMQNNLNSKNLISETLREIEMPSSSPSKLFVVNKVSESPNSIDSGVSFIQSYIVESQKDYDHPAFSDEDEFLDDVMMRGEKGSLMASQNSQHSNSDNLSQSGYVDTIGPLDNPEFLRRLNRSLSQYPGVEEAQFEGSQTLEHDPSHDHILPDLDRGYAWVVLAAAVMALAITGATCFAAGVLMSSILDKIDPDITKAAWIGGVHVCTMCMCGPFVGIILNSLGSRLTVVLASLVMCAGFVGASFAESVLQLVLTHGLVAGVGSGFVLNTMFVSVGQRFNRYRGIACGMLATGSGFGMLTGGAAMSTLLEMYGLKGTYLLWAGVVLHIAVCGMLLQPSGEQKIRAFEIKSAKEQIHLHSKGEGSIIGSRQSIASSAMSRLLNHADQTSLFSSRSTVYNRKPEIQRLISHASSKTENMQNSLLRSVLHVELSKSNLSVATEPAHKPNKDSASPSSPQVVGRFSYRPASLHIHKDIPLDESSSAPTSPIFPAKNKFVPTHLDSPKNQPKLITSSDRRYSNSTFENTPESPVMSNRSSLDLGSIYTRRLQSVDSSKSHSHYTSNSHLSHREGPHFRDLFPKEYDNESLAETLVTALQPMDTLHPRYHLGHRSISTIMGSILSLPTSLAIVKDDLARVGDMVAEDDQKSVKEHISNAKGALQVLKNRPFLVFMATCFLMAFGNSPIAIYLPSYAISKGTSILQASSLYTSLGFGSMIGRFLSGLIASDSNIGPVLLHIGCLNISGLLIALTPVITASFTHTLVLVGVYGLYSGSLVPLISLITIELLGVEEIGQGFGFLSLFQGLGFLMGPPFAGMIVKYFGYDMAFVFSGLVLIFASLVEMLVVIFLKKPIDYDNISDSLDALENNKHESLHIHENHLGHHHHSKQIQIPSKFKLDHQPQSPLSAQTSQPSSKPIQIPPRVKGEHLSPSPFIAQPSPLVGVNISPPTISLTGPVTEESHSTLAPKDSLDSRTTTTEEKLEPISEEAEKQSVSGLDD